METNKKLTTKLGTLPAIKAALAKVAKAAPPHVVSDPAHGFWNLGKVAYCRARAW